MCWFDYRVSLLVVLFSIFLFEPLYGIIIYYISWGDSFLIKNILLSTLLLATTAFAFDTRTHVFIAQEIINDLNDSKLTIEPFGDFEVDGTIVDAILANKKVFRMGNIGPDGFPDVVGGQVTVHPGLEDGTIDDGSELVHGWKSDEWFQWILQKAQTPQEKAFAYGFLLHGAADTFAHSYVNMYAGDIFDMNDGETDVEKRHIFLEKYISDRLPPLKDTDGVAIGNSWDVVAVDDELPVAFITKNLLMNDTVAEQYALSGTASYLAKLYEFRQKVAALDDEDTQKSIASDLETAKNECDTPWYPGKYLTSLFSSKDEACSQKDYLNAKLKKLKSLQLPSYSFKRAWLTKIDDAIAAYIKTSSRMSQQFMMVNGDPYNELTQWMTCYSSAFTDPTTIASSTVQEGCKLSEEVEEQLGFLDDVAPKEDFTQISGLKLKVKDLSDSLGSEIVSLIGVAAVEIILVKEKSVSEADLNEQFGIDDSDKHLLLINDMAQRVNLEMALDMNEELNPEKFYVLHNAIVLAKLALLSPEQLNVLLQRAKLSNEYTFTDSENLSLLIGSIKTIDGNQQWLHQAPPYPRMEGFEDNIPHFYGYENDVTHGWKLFSNERLRKYVFNKIFKGPLALGLETPEVMHMSKLLPDSYPYVSCAENPFPNGVDDKSCLTNDIVTDPVDDNLTTEPDTEPDSKWYDDLISYLKSVIMEYFNSLVPAEYIVHTTQTEDSVAIETKVPDNGIEF